MAAHQAACVKRVLPNGKRMTVNIAPNACHLESIDPVLLGSIRGKLDMKK